MTNASSSEPASQIRSNVTPLQDSELIVAGVFLALANFLVVLDTTIANVSVSHIAGGLGISSTEGTYVITSYAVAEAITVPLTGWLAGRFGTMRVFTTCILLFGLFSGLCGFAGNLMTLVAGRVLQGLAGGPLMPLSQTLLMQIFPKEKRGAAIGLWSMTTLIAPILGPIVGGYICDNWRWEFIFYINIPIAVVCSGVIMKLLRRFETALVNAKIDFVGLGLLIVWVFALQILLDEGKNLDWFESNEIWLLFIVALIGFLSFMIWEFTHDQPIVNLRVFRHRGYCASVLTISLAFGAYFGSVVLTPIWLQTYMGYTATWSGLTTAATGVSALFVAPFVAKFSGRYDARILVFIGVSWIGLMTFVRCLLGTTDMTYAQVAWPLLIQGLGMPFFFIPLTGLALASVNPEETASAAGLMSFLRTLSGAFATSLVTTVWENQTNVFRSELTSRMDLPEHMGTMLSGVSSMGQENALFILDQTMQSQAVMLATNHVFLLVACMFVFAGSAIWLAPKPIRKAAGAASH